MDNYVELRQIVRILLRHWWVLIAGAIIAGGLGYAISLAQTPVYSATTTLYVGRSIRSSDLDRTDLQLGVQLALTYADLVRRKPVLQGTVEELRLSGSWQELKRRVEVSPVENTQLLEIRVKADSPLEAQMTADTIARQLLLIGPIASSDGASGETREFAQQRLLRLQANIEEAEHKLDELEAKIVTLVGTAIDQVPRVQEEVQTLELLIYEWDSTYANLLNFLNDDTSANHLAIVETAEATPNPIQPRVQLNTLIAAVVGLGLAIGLTFFMEYLDDRLKPTDVVSEILGLNTLGSISPMQGKTLNDRLIIKQNPFSPASEDYRLLRNKIQMLCGEWQRKIIMLTSPTPSEMKSVTVANLGIVLAQAGAKVIIVDVNLRQPLQHELFQIPMRRGLTDILYQTKRLANDVLQNTEVMGLQVLTVGGLQPPHPTELLGSVRLGELLRQLAEQADIVLCDSAHAVAIADAVVLSSHVDGTVLVVDVGKTRRATAEQAVRTLRQTGVNLLGTVLSSLPADKVSLMPFRTPAVPGSISNTLST
jgi:non-specific protein-tyrosine kinase